MQVVQALVYVQYSSKVRSVTAHERMYVLVSAIHTLALCMCMIVCTIRSVDIYVRMYSTCINYVYTWNPKVIL